MTQTSTAIRFGQPQQIHSLKEAKLWSMDFCESKFPGQQFRFYCLEKAGDSYLVHGHADDASSAFALRRKLAEELGAKVFIRAKRIERPHYSAFGDDDSCYERFKDWYAEGISTQDVPSHLRSEYVAFLNRRGRSAR